MDIIFFAAVALFIFFRLRGQFGKVDEDQKREAIKKFLKEQADIASNKSKSQGNENLQGAQLDESKLRIVNPDDAITPQDNNVQILSGLSAPLKTKVVKVLEKSKVTVSDFMNGAEMAFEMVVNSFSEGDKGLLKGLLSKDLSAKFEVAINQRIQDNQKLNTNIISVDKAVIKDAKVQKNDAIIVVNFISKQIIYTIDANNNILDGSKDLINEVSDVWTFSRDVRSKNPNWTIIATKS